MPKKTSQKPSESHESYFASIDSGSNELQATLFKLDNAVLVFFYETKTIKLGTLALALPQFEGQSNISSILIGNRNQVMTRILAGHIAQRFHVIALVSTHLPEIREANTSSVLLKLADKLLETTHPDSDDESQ